MNLASIANVYNPLLLLVSITLAVYWGFKFKSARGLVLVIFAIAVYAFMFLDNKYLIWPAVGLDYSTHTATALAMCIFIGTTVKNFFMKTVLAISLLAYCELMVVLSYHSWMDIVSTAVPVGLILSLIYYFAGKSRLLTIASERSNTQLKVARDH
jgi:hypothetical protein